MTWIILAAAAAALVLLLWLSDAKLARKRFGQAEAFESHKDFTRACYHYSMAGGMRYKRKECIRRIQALWQERGPFDFSSVEEDHADPESPGCARVGHEMTVDFVKKAVSRDNEE